MLLYMDVEGYLIQMGRKRQEQVTGLTYEERVKRASKGGLSVNERFARMRGAISLEMAKFFGRTKQ